jgi:hypothetical protein
MRERYAPNMSDPRSSENPSEDIPKDTSFEAMKGPQEGAPEDAYRTPYHTVDSSPHLHDDAYDGEVEQ